MSPRDTVEALVNSNRSAPKPHLSIVEATSFCAFGGFLASDDLATVFASETQNEKIVERFERSIKKSIEDGKPVEPHEIVVQWSGASEEIRKKAHDGELTFYGLHALSLSARPTSEEEQIPVGFFAGKGTLIVGLNGTLHRNDRSREGYYDGVWVDTDQFIAAFPAAKAVRGGGSKPKYPWPEFIDEAVRQLEQEGDFGVDPDWIQATLEDRMARWCSKWGKVPCEARIRTKVKEAREEYIRLRKAS